ncbi:SDR family NAD(P)-dependent oxidoreductase [Saxibacter everestensis]|uniref:SDR family NAD(P)-dependent oxidoreductase n=1 Tax=Saxibacter everestensis TaxID=2909229 RepID=A0ABY8QVX4_9MICO|nr:SDR family NAD(P)-dependent oxidoreductase [Brevibacteriaceae bacterium ZFBP1038]
MNSYIPLLAESTVVLTGASSGIGAATARRLSHKTRRLILVGQSSERLAATAAETGAEFLTADYADLDQVRALASELSRTTDHIDLMFHNAGAMWKTRDLTVDGNERTMQVNAIAPYLLTRSLGPLLEGGRVISTTSITGLRTRPGDLEQLDSSRRYKPWDAYAASKLAVSLMVREFTRRVPETEFADVHPGVVTTGLIRRMPGQQLLAASPLRTIASRFMSTPEQAANALISAGTTPQSIAGVFFDQLAPRDPGNLVTDQNLAAKLWNSFADRSHLSR